MHFQSLAYTGVGIQVQAIPAVDGDGVVPRLALHLANLLNGVSDSLEVAAVAIGSPVDDVELCDLMGLPRLGGAGGKGGVRRGREGGREGEERKGRREGREEGDRGLLTKNMEFVLVKFS